MFTFDLSIADFTIRCSVNYEYSLKYCKDYIRCAEGTDAPAADLFVVITPEDIRDEFRWQDPAEDFTGREAYIESLALYRKICTQLALRDTVLIHGSSLMKDGIAFLFCAPSGTGKSTHTRLWRQVYGSDITMINDDKPLVRITKDGTPRIYGTPWNGKHRLGAPISAPLRNICFLERGEKNSIAPADKKSALQQLLRFTFRPDEPVETAATLGTLDTIIRCSSFWQLKCNMDPQAAVVSCEGMTLKG